MREMLPVFRIAFAAFLALPVITASSQSLSGAPSPAPAAQGANAPAAVPAQEPPAQGPTFRTGVDILTVDVSVVDGRGRPVEDLRAPEFTVRIDGQPRRVVSVDLVKFDVEAATRQAEARVETHFTTNLTPPNGRLIVIAVDQLGIAVGRARPVLQTAARFLDSLSPADRVAFVAYPDPGVYVDFTSDRIKLRQAMERVVGSQQRLIGKLNIGLYEAIAIIDRSDDRIFDIVVARECRGMRGFVLENCQRDVLSESGTMVTGVRQATISSLSSLTMLMQQLALLPGPKSLILLSEGIVLDSPTQINQVSQDAARANVSVNVLMMDVPRDDITISQMRPTINEDRDLQMSGLRNLAAASMGEIYTVVGTGQAIFSRLSSELAAYYVLGVEEAAIDRDPGEHRVDVEVRRNNVSVRSRRAFVLSAARTAARRRDPGDVLADILKSPFGVADLPLRVTTFARQDPSGEKVRLLVAADVGQPGMPEQQFDVGYILIDANGTVVSSGADRRRLAPTSDSPAASLEYLGEMIVNPGVYTLRLAVVDADGRRGGIVREVNAWKLSGEEFALGDLMVGDASDPGASQGIRPAVEPRVSRGVGAYIEFYSTTATALDGAIVAFEIAREEAGEALVAGRAQVSPGERPTTRTASGVLSTALLPPGRYVARARVVRNGAVAGVLARPFVIDAPAPAGDAAAIVPNAPVLVLSNIEPFDVRLVLGRDLIGSMLDMLDKTSPGLKEALVEARAGRYSTAAVEALTAGDQTAAAFLKGLDWFTKGQMEQAAQQLQIAAGPRREFFPAAFYLGASLAATGRDRDAAGVWQLAFGAEPRPAVAYAVFADARFRDRQPAAVIEVLKPAHDRTPADDGIARRLATAYLLTERYADALPVLDTYLSRNGTDQDMLFAVVFAQYQISSRNRVPLSTADLDKLARYVRAYRGPSAALLGRYLETIRGN